MVTLFPQIDNIFLLKYLGVSLKSSNFATQNDVEQKSNNKYSLSKNKCL